MSETWRLITHAPAEGAWNMAVDEALLQRAEDGKTLPVLRFYSWEKPTLSIGKLQKIEGVFDTEYLARKEIPLVRRPTGGRALLHHHEVTYSITLPASSAMYGSLDQVYSRITAALRQALGHMGARLDMAPQEGEAGYAASQACFAGRTGHELSIGGRKVCAAAQRRLAHSVMQHGSILLKVDVETHLNCFLWNSQQERQKAAEAMAGLCDILKRPISYQEVAESIIWSFKQTRGIKLQKSILNSAEMGVANGLMKKEG